MTAIGFEIPADITRIVGSLTQFVRAEVVTRHERHAALLDDPRQRYGPTDATRPRWST